MVDRSVQPQIILPKEGINVLKCNKITTTSKSDIYWINTGELDLIRVSFVFRAGVKYQNRPFVASATLNMLVEGSQNFSSEALSEMLDFYGIYYEANIDRDYTVITVCSVNKFFEPAMEFLQEVVLRPLFLDEELKIYSAKRKQNLKIERTIIDFKARELFAKSLFGENHPYGFASLETDYDTLTTGHLKEFYDSYYCSQNMFCVVSGKIEDKFLQQVASIIDAMPSGKKAQHNMAEVNTTYKNYQKIDEVLQSAIRIGVILFDRNHPDYVGMQVLATILGGYFGSRLVKNLREDKGYTYGAFAGLANFESSGYMAISTEVVAEFTEDAIAQIYKEIDSLKTELVTISELQMVKSVMLGEIMRILDGPFAICDVALENIQNGTDNSFVDSTIAKINAIEPSDIKRLANIYLQRNNFVEVVVGNPPA